MKFVLVSVCIFVLIGQGFTDCPNKLYPSFGEAMAAIVGCLFPSEKFNASCISDSCPDLKKPDLCPYLSNGNGRYNITAVNKSLDVASKCFQQADTICGVPIKTDPFPTVSILLLNTAPPLALNFTVNLNPGSVFIKQLPQTTFYLISKSDPQNLIVDINNPDIFFIGQDQIIFTYGGVNGTDLKPVVIPVDNITAMMDLGANIITNISLNSTTNPTFQVNQISTVPKVQISAVNLGPLLNLLNAGGIFSYVIQNLVQVSDIPKALANFLSTFIMYALQVTAQYCQKTT